MGEDDPGKLRPTIVAPPPRRKPAAGGSEPLPRPHSGPGPTVLKPTMIAGAARQNLVVTPAELRRLSAGADQRVLDAAIAMLAAIVPDTMTERRAILWGHELQQGYADTVARSLELSQAPMMRKVEGHVSRMLEILTSFDLAGAARPEGNGLGGLFKAFNRKTDTVAELAGARGELDQLAGLLRGALEELLTLKGELEANAATLDAVAIDAEAAALAALYLSEQFVASKPVLAQRFTERSMSLTQTLAQIRSSDSLRSMQLEQPIRMITAIQNVTLVSIPDFLTSLAAIGALAARNTAMTPTDARELNFKLHDIIRQLQP